MNPRLIIDAHEDVAYNALVMGRDFHLAAQATRARATTA